MHPRIAQVPGIEGQSVEQVRVAEANVRRPNAYPLSDVFHHHAGRPWMALIVLGGLQRTGTGSICSSGAAEKRLAQ
jgi:hypothetical protein